MTVRTLCENDVPAFKELFRAYYTELDCEENPLSLFDEYLLPDLKAGLFEVAVCETEDNICGFVIFQIDDVINDWNFKEGRGDVRELFVAAYARGNGAGSALLRYGEARLKDMGADEIYTLPTEESEAFFIKCGYEDTGEYCPEADNKVFGKLIDKTDNI